MCIGSSGRSEGGLKAEGNHSNAISHPDNGGRDVKERAHSPLLNVSISSPNALNNSGQFGYIMLSLQPTYVVVCWWN